MLCLLRVELELSIQAKAAVMVREAGVILPVHDDARHALEEVQYLRASIGTDRRAGAAAVRRDVAPRRLAPVPPGRPGRQTGTPQRLTRGVAPAPVRLRGRRRYPSSEERAPCPSPDTDCSIGRPLHGVPGRGTNAHYQVHVVDDAHRIPHRGQREVAAGAVGGRVPRGRRLPPSDHRRRCASASRASTGSGISRPTAASTTFAATCSTARACGRCR